MATTRSKSLADPISTDPSQAGPPGHLEIDKALTKILERLGKLDLICEDIKNMKSDIIGLVDSLRATEHTAQEALSIATDSQTKVKELEKDLQAVKLELQKAKNDNTTMREHIIKTEAQERRNNLIFEGCAEKVGENREDCLDIVYKILGEQMEIDNPTSIVIDRCHRMPAQSNQKAKPIILKVHYFSDREKIWNSRGKLKGSGIWINEDYPVEIKKRRQILQPIMRKARQDGLRSSLSYDRLYVAGKMYTVNTTNYLPNSLKPEEIATRRSESYTGFFSMSSPLSNFSLCSFKDVDGMMFTSMEQYYQYQKALYNGNHESARSIMATDDPAQCKYFGNKIHIPDLKNWEDKAMEIMYTGCLAKFTQNPKHQDFLLSTADTTLVEANPRDKFWSAGLNLKDDNLFDTNAWKGKNYLGTTLMKVRDTLRA